MATDRFAGLDIYLEEQMKRLNIPGAALAVVEGERIVHLHGFGRARPGGGAPVPQTPFFIGSLTKSFTALAVMQLVEAGKIELDAPLQCYLPWFRVADPRASTQMTVRHLLNQSSGFSQKDGWYSLADFDEGPGSTERQARNLATCRLIHPPGTAFEYSNVNYNLLGLVVEAASGEPYADYIRGHIFEPLEMKHSHTSKAAAREDGLAVGHQSWFGFPVAVADLPEPSGALPSGQLISSAEDLGHYLIAHLNQGRYNGAQVLSAQGIAELFRPAVEVDTMGFAEADYGMGWFVEETAQGVRLSHKGTVPDFFAYMALLPEQKLGMVLLANANQLLIDYSMLQVCTEAATLLAGGAPRELPNKLVPWALRAAAVLPILQVCGAAAGLRLARRWRQDPGSRPSRRRSVWQQILLPLIPNLSLAAIPVLLRKSGLGRFMFLYLPDLSTIALISGAFAGAWSLVRTGLFLGMPGKPSPAKPGASRTIRKTGKIIPFSKAK